MSECTFCPRLLDTLNAATHTTFLSCLISLNVNSQRISRKPRLGKSRSSRWMKQNRMPSLQHSKHIQVTLGSPIQIAIATHTSHVRITCTDCHSIEPEKWRYKLKYSYYDTELPYSSSCTEIQGLLITGMFFNPRGDQ